MRVRLGVLTGVALVGLMGSAQAPARPERDALIRMGSAIGKIEIGMTMPQVRRALGGPHVTVYRRVDFGARGRYLELGWELPGRTSWEPVIWRVGFRSWTPRGTVRVVRVGTTTRSERTPERIGVGSTIADIVRAYPRASCVGRPDNIAHPGGWIVVGTGRGMTAFEVRSFGQGLRRHNRVVFVMVQRTWYSTGGVSDCGEGWRER